VQVVLWSDYICPWCYLGRDRTALLVELGCDVESRPYELHPNLPPEGRMVRPGGRLSAVHDDIARQCADVGLPFRPPTHVPNSRRALETAEIVRQDAPMSFPTLDATLFRAHFVEGRDISDARVIDALVTDAGADATSVRERVETGAGRQLVRDSIERANEQGIAGTPAWLFASGLVVPGVQPRELFMRVVDRLRARIGE